MENNEPWTDLARELRERGLNPVTYGLHRYDGWCELFAFGKLCGSIEAGGTPPSWDIVKAFVGIEHNQYVVEIASACLKAGLAYDDDAKEYMETVEQYDGLLMLLALAYRNGCRAANMEEVLDYYVDYDTYDDDLGVPFVDAFDAAIEKGETFTRDDAFMFFKMHKGSVSMRPNDELKRILIAFVKQVPSWTMVEYACSFFEEDHGGENDSLEEVKLAVLAVKLRAEPYPNDVRTRVRNRARMRRIAFRELVFEDNTEEDEIPEFDSDSEEDPDDEPEDDEPDQRLEAVFREFDAERRMIASVWTRIFECEARPPDPATELSLDLQTRIVDMWLETRPEFAYLRGWRTNAPM